MFVPTRESQLIPWPQLPFRPATHRPGCRLTDSTCSRLERENEYHRRVTIYNRLLWHDMYGLALALSLTNRKGIMDQVAVQILAPTGVNLKTLYRDMSDENICLNLVSKHRTFGVKIFHRPQPNVFVALPVALGSGLAQFIFDTLRRGGDLSLSFVDFVEAANYLRKRSQDFPCSECEENVWDAFPYGTLLVNGAAKVVSYATAFLYADIYLWGGQLILMKENSDTAAAHVVMQSAFHNINRLRPEIGRFRIFGGPHFLYRVCTRMLGTYPMDKVDKLSQMTHVPVCVWQEFLSAFPKIAAPCGARSGVPQNTKKSIHFAIRVIQSQLNKGVVTFSKQYRGGCGANFSRLRRPSDFSRASADADDCRLNYDEASAHTFNKDDVAVKSVYEIPKKTTAKKDGRKTSSGNVPRMVTHWIRTFEQCEESRSQAGVNSNSGCRPESIFVNISDICLNAANEQCLRFNYAPYAVPSASTPREAQHAGFLCNFRISEGKDKAGSKGLSLLTRTEMSHPERLLPTAFVHDKILSAVSPRVKIGGRWVALRWCMLRHTPKNRDLGIVSCVLQVNSDLYVLRLVEGFPPYRRMRLRRTSSSQTFDTFLFRQRRHIIKSIARLAHAWKGEGFMFEFAIDTIKHVPEGAFVRMVAFADTIYVRKLVWDECDDSRANVRHEYYSALEVKVKEHGGAPKLKGISFLPLPCPPKVRQLAGEGLRFNPFPNFGHLPKISYNTQQSRHVYVDAVSDRQMPLMAATRASFYAAKLPWNPTADSRLAFMNKRSHRRDNARPLLIAFKSDPAAIEDGMVLRRDVSESDVLSSTRYNTVNVVIKYSSPVDFTSQRAYPIVLAPIGGVLQRGIRNSECEESLTRPVIAVPYRVGFAKTTLSFHSPFLLVIAGDTSPLSVHHQLLHYNPGNKYLKVTLHHISYTIGPNMDSLMIYLTFAAEVKAQIGCKLVNKYLKGVVTKVVGSQDMPLIHYPRVGAMHETACVCLHAETPPVYLPTYLRRLPVISSPEDPRLYSFANESAPPLCVHCNKCDWSALLRPQVLINNPFVRMLPNVHLSTYLYNDDLFGLVIDGVIADLRRSGESHAEDDVRELLTFPAYSNSFELAKRPAVVSALWKHVASFTSGRDVNSGNVVTDEMLYVPVNKHVSFTIMDSIAVPFSCAENTHKRANINKASRSAISGDFTNKPPQKTRPTAFAKAEHDACSMVGMPNFLGLMYKACTGRTTNVHRRKRGPRWTDQYRPIEIRYSRQCSDYREASQYAIVAEKDKNIIAEAMKADLGLRNGYRRLTMVEGIRMKKIT